MSDPLSDLSPFDADDLKLFQTLASHTAVALENGQLEQSLSSLSRLQEELQHKAYHDALTGLANRAFFAQSVAQRLESADPLGAGPGRAVPRPRRLQDRQRHPRAMPPATNSWRPSASASRRRCGRATWPPGSAATSSRSSCWDTPEMPVARRVAERLIGGVRVVPPREGAAVERSGQHRRRGRPPGLRLGRRAAPQRRRRDVLGEGARQEPGRLLRARDGDGGRGPRTRSPRRSSEPSRPRSSSSTTSRSSTSRRAG